MDFNISQSNKHNINLICLYILDLILFFAILYIYKCTEIKLGHLRKGMRNHENELMEKGLREPKSFQGLQRLEVPSFEAPRLSKFEEL